MIFERKPSSLVLYVLTITHILGKLPLVPVMDTGTFPHLMPVRGESAEFPARHATRSPARVMGADGGMLYSGPCPGHPECRGLDKRSKWRSLKLIQELQFILAFKRISFKVPSMSLPKLLLCGAVSSDSLRCARAQVLARARHQYAPQGVDSLSHGCAAFPPSDGVLPAGGWPGFLATASEMDIRGTENARRFQFALWLHVPI